VKHALMVLPGMALLAVVLHQTDLAAG